MITKSEYDTIVISDKAAVFNNFSCMNNSYPLSVVL